MRSHDHRRTAVASHRLRPREEYRYDDDYNGEVVAECKREDLNSFLGLHYPSTDIPAQARAVYEKSWLRLSLGRRLHARTAGSDHRPGERHAAGPHARDAAQRLAHPHRVPAEHGCARVDVDLVTAGRAAVGAHRLPPLRRSASAAVRHPRGGKSSSVSTLSLRLVDRAEDDQVAQGGDADAVLAKLSRRHAERQRTVRRRSSERPICSI